MMARAASPSRASSFIRSLRAARRAVTFAISTPKVRQDYRQGFGSAQRTSRSTRMSVQDEKPLDGQDAGAGLIRAAERVADQLDAMVPVSEDAGNQVLTDDTKLVRWT